ncbi:TetR family transcriptional regulator [Aliidiomarina sedimenti]|uniref:TetR family transcriptional regulator n=1 Tax=Aliidiomarina sedimenti TaxID=1933879 RepID=A0ABY0C3F8_9GAMM|nr:TetR/AcrR family transcriptional regulator [Aliidiomarina sedimenti]RUO32117.1 TetR family transcriptional regulator [Aliidiomarina sedimenti]
MAKVLKTKDKILNAAERLFADQGFELTSLRQITGAADVNLASVNYHFGSKKALIQAVMERYHAQFMPELDERLKTLEGQGINSTEEVLSCFVGPLLSLQRINPLGTEIYLSLLGHAYSEIQGHLRRFTMQNFGHVVQRFFHCIQQANPHLSVATLFWRLHFTLGATVFAQVSGQALSEIAQADFGESATAEDIVGKLIPYLAAGIGAAEVSASARL